jgi:hypothetical protein
MRRLLFTHLLLLVEHRLRTAAPGAGPQPVLVEGVVALVEGKGQWGFSWCVWGVADYK